MGDLIDKCISLSLAYASFTIGRLSGTLNISIQLKDPINLRIEKETRSKANCKEDVCQIFLISHTLQSQEKEGQVTMLTASCSSARNPGVTNQIRDFVLLAARVHIAGHARFTVIRDGFFCNYCIPQEQLVRKVTRPSLS